jgi:hypothetical protein
MATFPSNHEWSFRSNDEWYANVRRRSESSAKQTRRRARSKTVERERARLLALGADPEWLNRVLPNG